MRWRPHKFLLVWVFALALAGCGSGDGTIPPDEADNLLDLLQAVERDVDAGDCELAQEHAAELISRVNELPKEVDPEVAGELTKAATNLDELAANPDQCTDTGASGETGVEPTTTTETTETTEEPETTTTETTTTEEKPPEQEETTTIEPPDQEPQEDPSQQPPSGPGGGQGGSGGGVEPPTGGIPGGGRG